MNSTGTFTISLDFELFWGVRDHRTLESYGNNIENVHKVIPRLLELFTKYEIHSTWATVGFIFCKNQTELQSYAPVIKPMYVNKKFNQYEYLQSGNLDNIYHYAPDIIDLILATPGQEMATHTYSHYYTLEEGANINSFSADIEQAKMVASKKNVVLESIVFPRNQYNVDFLEVCRTNNISIYRGTEKSWLYKTRSRTEEKQMRRALRFADSYFNLSGHHTFSAISCVEDNGMWNIPSSRFLRPYHPKLQILDIFKMKRIQSAMLNAAKKGEVYHIWWHPHNFGSYIDQNFSFLEEILQYFHTLKNKYAFKSLNLIEIKKYYGQY